MKRKFGLIATSLILVSACAPGSSWGRTPGSRSGAAYDPNTERTVKGVVEAIEGQPGPLMLAGAHLILLTSEGRLDVHLGSAEPGGGWTYGLQASDSVEVTGSMIHFNGTPVLLARTVKRGNQVLTLRNRLGFPVTARATTGRGGLAIQR